MEKMQPGRIQTRLFTIEKENEDPEGNYDFSAAQFEKRIENDSDLAYSHFTRFEDPNVFPVNEVNSIGREEVNQHLTPIMIGSLRSLALVDSGAYGCFMNLDFGRKLGVKIALSDTKQVSRGGKVERAYQEVPVEIHNGTRVVSLAITPMESLKYDVVIGRDAFHKFGFRVVGVPNNSWVQDLILFLFFRFLELIFYQILQQLYSE
jgi:hypothetical protein